MINVLIVTGNNEERKKIVSVISNQNDLQITGIENDEANAVIKSKQLKPDVLIMDMQPSAIDGVELAAIIRRRSPDTAIIMISDKDDGDYAGMAIRAGISGFLLREADMNRLIHAVKIVNSGGYYINDSIIKRTIDTISLMKQFSGQASDIIKNWQEYEPCLSFTPIERSIITEIAHGFSDKEIASHLNYSIGTVKNHLSIIKRKTKMKNRIQIAAYSIVFGLINLNQFNIYKSNRHISNDRIQ